LAANIEITGMVHVNRSYLASCLLYRQYQVSSIDTLKGMTWINIYKRFWAFEVSFYKNMVFDSV